MNVIAQVEFELAYNDSAVHRFNHYTMIFIIKAFRTIVFIFIVISTTFRPICPPAFFRCLLSKFLRWSLMIFIIRGFRTIVFIFIVISTTFRPICPPAFFRCLSNAGTFTELRTSPFIETTGSPVLIPLAITEYKC